MEPRELAYEEETEIDLKDLIVCILRKWKSIVLWMIVFALVLGAYKLIVGPKDSSAQLTEEQQTTISNDESAIESAKVNIESRQPLIDEYNDRLGMYQEMLADYEDELQEADADDRVQILSNIADLNDIIMSVQQSRSNVQQEINNNNSAITTAQEEIDSIQQTVEEEQPSRTKETIKFAIIGAILGAFLVCAYVAIRYIFANRLRTNDELKMLGIRVLGSLYDPRAARKKGANGLIDRTLDKLEGYPKPVNPKKEFQLIAANICVALGDKKMPILVTGTADEKHMARLQQQLSRLLPQELYTIHMAPNPNRNPHAMLKLNQHAILLVEAKNTSRMTELTQLVESVRASGAPIIGAVVV